MKKYLVFSSYRHLHPETGTHLAKIAAAT